MADPKPDNDIVISISNLVKKFGDLAAVDGLSLDIYKGEVLGFLGPNGAGKTTTINMICGLSQPTKGDIFILGDRIRHNPAIKAHIGICPQENIYWPKLTCLEQVAFMGQMYGLTRRIARSRAKELLELMGLAAKSNVLANKLSGGMRRRLNICLALIHDPEILVLDEPESGLDPQSRILVRSFIQTLAEEKTIILTTHNMDEADKVSDRVAIIDHGKLLLLDTPENMKKSIGEGDNLKIVLDTDETEDLGELVEDLLQICDDVKGTDATVHLRALNIIGQVSEITTRIQRHGFGIREITMRENTLEDVFIHLTGRTLRT